MRIGIEQELGPGCSSHFDNMAVGQAVPLAGTDFHEYACGGCQVRFFEREQTRMGEYVDMLGPHSSQVGTGLNRLNKRLAMDDDNFGSQVFGMSGCIRYSAGRNMSKLDAGNGNYVPVAAGHGAVFTDFMDYAFKAAQAHMIGDGNGLIAGLHGSPDELDGCKLAIAQCRMGVEIKNGWLPPD